MRYFYGKFKDFSPASFQRWLFESSPQLQAQLVLALIFSAVISILPTRRAHNIGYVDPSMYIGYASNFSWLIESSGYEYHATRLPLIGLIKLLLLFETSLFGILYKFSLMFILTLSVLGLCRKLKLNEFQCIVALLLIGFSPITQSAISWTMPNGFAGIFSTAVLIFGLISRSKPLHIFILGALILNCFLLNAFGSIFVIIPLVIIKLVGKKDFFDLLRWMVILSSGIVCCGLVYQFAWNSVLGIQGSFWGPHINVILDPNTSALYWRQINSPIEQGLASLMVIGVFLIIIGAKHDDLRFQNLKFLRITGLSILVISFLTYFLKQNFSFSEFWYFYIYIPLFALSAVSISSLLQEKLAIGIFLIIGGFYTLILPRLEIKASLENMIVIGGVTITCVFLVKNLEKVLSRYRIQTLPKTLIGLFGFLLLFQFTQFQVSYENDQNSSEVKLINDQLRYNKILASQTPIYGRIATWYEPDDTGYRGSIISSSGFHLLRLEGVNPNSKTFEASSWNRDHRNQPECLVQITSVNWQPESFWKDNSSYKMISTELLPSGSVKVSIFCEDNK